MMLEHTLQSLSPRVAVDASYLTIRFIKHLAKHPKDYIVPDMLSEPGPEAQAAALELVQKIERIEGTTVSALGGGSADAYIDTLATFISERVKDDVGIDISRGQRLLEDLRGAYPPETNLLEGNLRGADLRRAYLKGANLQRADLREADLRGTDLRGTDLQESNLQDADLRGANLRRADLRGANLQEADLQGAYLQEADLRGAYLQKADLLRAYLQEADLQDADLLRVNFREAYLQGADLQGAEFQGADLQGAYLHRADLEGAMRLTQEQLEQAVGDENTTIPGGLTRPVAWWDGSAGARTYIKY